MDAMAIIDLTLTTAVAFSGKQLASATRIDGTAASGSPAPSAAQAAWYASSEILAQGAQEWTIRDPSDAFWRIVARCAGDSDGARSGPDGHSRCTR